MRSILGVLALAAALTAWPGRADDVFSPGPLSRAHQALEGLGQCTRCHVAGHRLASSTCLGCHAELAPRVAAGRGFHGRLPPAQRDACQTCHHEHQGRDFPLVDWGKGGRDGFDHARAGFELRGKHRRVDCARCHDPRLVADPAVTAALRKAPGRRTLLGAPQRCAACHFDEHRGQLGADCQRCHAEDGWRPARFDHARAAYRLDGKHLTVACARCHPAVEEPARVTPPAVTAPVRAGAFVRYRELPFQRCTDCHKDPHQERFGAACAGCHTTAGWSQVVGAGARRAFHERTRYPLRGAHLEVACAACHGPWPGVKARYQGMAFGQCTDCHADAHAGQLARAAPAGGAEAVRTCERCHGLEGFLPVRYDLADHARAAYRLEGAHRAVACAGCHPRDARLAGKLPAARRDLARTRRPQKVSLVVLKVPRADDCRTCHRDPHGGQLEARTRTGGCAACHGVDSFRKVRLDHARDTRFPLAGKHARAACASCHRPDAAGTIRYRPLPLACAGCHADVHAGQLARAGQGTACERCHGTEAWTPADRFVHAAPFTAFALEGKHRQVACEKCHPSVQVDGAPVRRYRPLPATCQGCHADFHRGAFRGYAP